MFLDRVRIGCDPLSDMLRCCRLFQEVPVLCRKIELSAFRGSAREQDSVRDRLASIHNSALHVHPREPWIGKETKNEEVYFLDLPWLSA